jgi:pimeloyl-ACP methyl ester carboxylesterase
LLAPLGEDITPVADAFWASGINADAMKHFNERIASAMDLRPLPARIDAPTLVLAGERDAFGGPTVDEIAEALPNPTVVNVAGVDHFAFLEPAGRAPWSRALLDFLAG